MASAEAARRLAEAEDAAELKFGEDFGGGRAKPLFNAEVFFILEGQREAEAADEDMLDRTASELFQKTLGYCQKFANFKTKDAARDVRRLLENKGLLGEWEVACLANLCPEQEEEAKYLLPSLDTRVDVDGQTRDRIDDHVLRELLDEMNVSKSFQA